MRCEKGSASTSREMHVYRCASCTMGRLRAQSRLQYGTLLGPVRVYNRHRAITLPSCILRPSLPLAIVLRSVRASCLFDVKHAWKM